MRNLKRNILISGVSALGILAMVTFSGDLLAMDNGTAFTSGFESIVDENGTIKLPEVDFRRDWTMLGAWVVSEEGRAKGLHNVYAEPGVVDHYKKTGEFPDGAILVKELLGAATGHYTTGTVSFANEISGWFVMVKDQKNRFEGNGLWGKGWGWAYFEAKDPKKLLTKNYKEECLTCHIPAEHTDWIYTEAYPVLGDQAKNNDRFKEILAEMAANPTEGDTSHGTEQVMETAELVKHGEKVFKRCKACHTVEAGKNKSGPYLAGVFGRKAGTAEGYNYSDAMKNSDVVWNDETLDKHLADVPGFIPGNRMGKVFRNGVKKPNDRKAVIEYLKTK